MVSAPLVKAPVTLSDPIAEDTLHKAATVAMSLSLVEVLMYRPWTNAMTAAALAPPADTQNCLSGLK